MTDSLTESTAKTEPVAQRAKRATRIGTVVSDKGDKTIKVRWGYMTKHPKYLKYMRRSTLLHAHDERNEAKPGDVVEIMGCRRHSRTKTWRLVKIIRAN